MAWEKLEICFNGSRWHNFKLIKGMWDGQVDYGKMEWMATHIVID
jgi:hypothetical protein